MDQTILNPGFQYLNQNILNQIILRSIQHDPGWPVPFSKRSEYFALFEQVANNTRTRAETFPFYVQIHFSFSLTWTEAVRRRRAGDLERTSSSIQVGFLLLLLLLLRAAMLQELVKMVVGGLATCRRDSVLQRREMLFTLSKASTSEKRLVTLMNRTLTTKTFEFQS